MSAMITTSHGSASSRLRGVLSRLILLFFLAHPGSAATFGETKNFLLSRYPNRDVVPSGPLRPAFSTRERRGQGVTSLFVTPPRVTSSPAATSPTLPTKEAEPSSWSSSAAGSAGAAAVSPPAAVTRPISPSRVRPCRVVVGDFVGSLERRAEAAAGRTRRTLLSFPPLTASPAGATEKAGMMAAAADGAGVIMAEVPYMQQREQQQQQQQPQQEQPQQQVMATISEEFWRKSTAPIFDAYDNVLSFVGSKLVASSLSRMLISTATDEHQLAQLHERGLRLTQLKSSSSRYNDLVGFMDCDPFEKSRRYFKRNAKLLL